MPRRPRLATGGLAYHVLNRRVGRLSLFEKPADYFAFEKILTEARDRAGVRIAAYCLMPNHWHLLLWPRSDGELSEVMRWITVTHTSAGMLTATHRGLDRYIRDGSNHFRFRLMSTSLRWRGM
jgi:REP element-mobilizing transposase RayT